MVDHRSVVVVGAGPAGSSTAFFLARSGSDVLLLDRCEFPRDKTCGDAVSPRAQHVLGDLGVLKEVSARARASHELRLFAPNHRAAVAEVPRAKDVDGRILVIDRRDLDHILQQRALEAGAEFRAVRVERLLRDGSTVSGVRLASGEEITARLVVLATGAATSLPKEAGLLGGKPHTMAAARGYFEGIDSLPDGLEFYFDCVALPGYAWLFPSGPGRANIGVGRDGCPGPSSRAEFHRVVREHPRLRELLRGARLTQPPRSHPLRTDFLRCRPAAPRVIAVGEAAGLVNPVTGEGIDYSLESGRIAGEVFGDALARGEMVSPERLDQYASRLDERFRKLFRVLRWASRVYYNGPMLNRILGRGPERSFLPRTFVEVCFGSADPMRVISPRTVVEILRP